MTIRDKSWMRELDDLRLIPEAERTNTQSRRYQTLMMRKSRDNVRSKQVDAKLQKICDSAQTREQFWQLNRAQVSAEQLAAWAKQSELVEDQLYWMRTFREQDSNDPDYVSLNEGLADLDNFVHEHGLIRDVFHSEVLKNFEPRWAIYADKNYDDPIWGHITAYYKDSERLKALCSENEPTRVWVLYGIRIAMDEFHYNEWKLRLRAIQQQVVAG